MTKTNNLSKIEEEEEEEEKKKGKKESILYNLK